MFFVVRAACKGLAADMSVGFSEISHAIASIKWNSSYASDRLGLLVRLLSLLTGINRLPSQNQSLNNGPTDHAWC